MRGKAPWIVAWACFIGMVVSIAVNWQRGIQLEQATKEERTEKENRTRSDQRVRALQAELESTKATLAKAQNSAEKAKMPAAQPPSDVLAISIDDLRKDPAYSAVWRRNSARMIQLQYGDAISAMKLTPDLEAKLRGLLFERTEVDADARQLATNSGLSPADANQAALNAQKDVSNEIQSLIGDDRYTMLQKASESGSAKVMISQTVGADLAAAGDPLTPDQLSALAQVYADATDTAKNPNVASRVSQAPDPVTGLTAYNQYLLSSASKVLTPDQASTMKNSLIQDQIFQQFIQKQRALNGGSSSGPVIVIQGGARPSP